MNDQDNKIDIFGPLVIFGFVSAIVGDFTFFLIVTHYLCGIFVLGVFWHKSKGFLAKAVLVAAFILPLPLLTIGMFISIILSNRVPAFIAEQVAIQAIAVGTAGAGEALEVGALAEEGVALTAEGVEAAGTAAEAGSAAVDAGEAAAETEGAESGAEAGEQSGDTVKDKIKEKFKEKLREKLLAGEDENQARQEIEQEENEEEQVDERYYDLTTPETEQDPIALEVKKMSKVVPINRAQEVSQEKPPAKPVQKENEATSRLSRRFEELQKRAQRAQNLGQPQVTEEGANKDEQGKDDDLAKAA